MAPRSEIIMIQAMNATLLVVIGVIFFIDRALAVQLAALVGTVWLSVLLIAPRLLHVVALTRWHEQLLQIARNSKWMGIWTALWFLLHGVTATLTHLQPRSPEELLAHLVSVPIVLGTLAAAILVVLISISNRWSYQHLKWWKHINMFIWLVAPLALAHGFLAAFELTGAAPFITVYILLPLSIIAGLSGIVAKKKDYFARIRVALLALGVTLGCALTLWRW